MLTAPREETDPFPKKKKMANNVNVGRIISYYFLLGSDAMEREMTIFLYFSRLTLVYLFIVIALFLKTYTQTKTQEREWEGKVP